MSSNTQMPVDDTAPAAGAQTTTPPLYQRVLIAVADAGQVGPAVELARQADAREARAAAEAPPGDPIWPKSLAFSMVNRAHCPGTPSLAEDRLNRAYRLAGAAAGTHAGLDAEHPLAFVDAVDRSSPRPAGKCAEGGLDAQSWRGQPSTSAGNAGPVLPAGEGASAALAWIGFLPGRC